MRIRGIIVLAPAVLTLGVALAACGGGHSLKATHTWWVVGTVPPYHLVKSAKPPANEINGPYNSRAAARSYLKTVNAVTAVTPSPTPDVEATICSKFRKTILNHALLHAMSYASTSGTNQPNKFTWAQTLLFRDAKYLAHWSYVVFSKVSDATFANYLGDAATQMGIVAAPYANYSQAQKAAADLGKINGYCKYDVS